MRTWPGHPRAGSCRCGLPGAPRTSGRMPAHSRRRAGQTVWQAGTVSCSVPDRASCPSAGRAADLLVARCTQQKVDQLVQACRLLGRELDSSLRREGKRRVAWPRPAAKALRATPRERAAALIWDCATLRQLLPPVREGQRQIAAWPLCWASVAPGTPASSWPPRSSAAWRAAARSAPDDAASGAAKPSGEP